MINTKRHNVRSNFMSDEPNASLFRLFLVNFTKKLIIQILKFLLNEKVSIPYHNFHLNIRIKFLMMKNYLV